MQEYERSIIPKLSNGEFWKSTRGKYFARYGIGQVRFEHSHELSLQPPQVKFQLQSNYNKYKEC